MQFLGIILLKSDLSLEEINTHYTSYKNDNWDYFVALQKTQEIDIVEHGKFSFGTDISNGTYYVVYSWGKGISPFRDFDLRGN